MRRPNHVLAKQLELAGWRPPQLVAAVNAVLGDGYVSRSTVSEWLHAGRIPREPLPAVVAQLLSRATGSRIRVRDLWPGSSCAPVWTVVADDGLSRIAGCFDPAVALAEDWVGHVDRTAGRDRRRFVPVPPDALSAVCPVSELPSLSDSGPEGLTSWAVLKQLSSHVGAPAALRFAHRQTVVLAETLIETPRDGKIAAGLALVTAHAGRLAEATGQLGLAQRYRASSSILVQHLHLNGVS